MIFYLADNTPFLNVEVDDDSYRFRELMGADQLVLKFNLTEHREIPVGAYCVYPDVGGTRYEVLTPESVTINHRRDFEYVVTLESQGAKLRKFKLYNPVDGRLKFDYTARAEEHLQLIVDNLTARYGSGHWAVGSCIASTEKLISYNHNTLEDVLGAIAETFETEWEITVNGDVTSISLGKVEYNASSPLPLSYGKGNGFVSGVSRTNFDDNLPIGKLYIEGGDRNIDYGAYPDTGRDGQHSATLLLPRSMSFSFDGEHFSDEYGYDSEKGVAMVTDAMGYYVKLANAPSDANEDSLDITDIYPSRVGRVTSVLYWNSRTKEYVSAPSPGADWTYIEVDIVDSQIPNDLDYSACLMDDETMTLVFQSGMLASREFEVKYRHTATSGRPAKRFELVKTEYDGVTMPSEYFVPVAGNGTTTGDEYAIFGIMLPAAYFMSKSADPSHSGKYVYSGASYDALREAATYLFKNKGSKYTFKGELDGIYAKRNWATIGSKLVIGGYVRFTDESVVGQDVHYDLRIASVKDFINNPYAPTIELSDEEVFPSGGLASDLRKLGAEPAHADAQYKSALQFTKRSFHDAQETSEMLEAAFADAWGSTVNPVSISTMQLLAGSEMLQIKFWSTAECTGAVSAPVTVNNTTGVVSGAACYLQHCTLDLPDDDVLTVAKSYSDYHRWHLASSTTAFTSLDPNYAYYVYAKCPSGGSRATVLDATYELSTEPMDLEEGGYYYFLVGILNSEREGSRSFAPLYGYTEILPGQIATGSVKNAAGTTILDLETGVLSLNALGATGVGSGVNGNPSLSNIAAWFGGPMADKEATPTPQNYAETLFRFDGTGYLSGGNITWNADGSGSVAGGNLSWDANGVPTIAGNITIGNSGGATIADLLAALYFENPSTGLVQLKSAYSYLGVRNGLYFTTRTVPANDTNPPDLYVKSVNGQRVLYSPLPLITGGDQIVIDGTPGGGGSGGAGFLYELGDIYHKNAQSEDVQYVAHADGSRPDAGDVLTYNATKGWLAAPSSGGGSGSVTSVGLSMPTGFSVSNSPVTSSGTIAVSFATGYSLPTTANQTAWSNKYDKPSGGIPKTDLATGVQTSLGLADSALQSHQTVTLESGTNNGTLKITTAAGTTDNVAVTGFSTVATNASNGNTAYGYFNSSGVLTYDHGGTGRSSAWTKNSVIYASSTSVLGQVTNVSGNDQKKFLVQTTNGSGTVAAPAWGTIDQKDVLGTSDIGSVSLPVYYKGASTYALSPITDLDLLGQATDHGYVKAKRFYLYSSGGTDVYFEWVPNSGNGYVKLNAPFLTEGDQIVNSGTPGGGGSGGAGYMYELGDVYASSNTIQRYYDNVTSGNVQVGDVLVYRQVSAGTYKWAAMPISAISGTTYTAGTGISISDANVISVTANTYAPYNSAGYLPLSAGSTKALTGALYVSAGSVYNLYLNNTGSGATSSGIRFQIAGSTIGELYTRTTDNELCWAGGNNGAKVIYHTGNLTLSNGVITIGSNTITPVTDVTYDSTSDRIQVTKGGSASNVLVGFATTSKRFARYQGENVAGGYDLDTLLSGGGITSQYGSSTYWANKPTGMTYGGVVQLNTQASDSLCMQFAWDVVHTSSTVGDTGKLWWRDKPTAGWGTWHLIYDSASLTKSVITGLLGNEYHPYGGGETIALSASSLTAYRGVTAYNAAKTYRLNFNFPTTGDALTVGRFYNATENGQTNGDLNIQSGLIYCVGASRVGINTSTPSSSYRLDVNGNVGVTGSLTTTGNITMQGTDRAIYMGAAGSEKQVLRLVSSLYLLLGSGTYDTLPTIIYGTPIRFYTNNNGTGAEMMRLLADGTLLIGATARPASITAKLYVNGATYLNGNATIPTGSTLTIGGATISWVAASGSTPGYLKINTALLTEGDQIVNSGTPGGGGSGGAGFLYELKDTLSGWTSNTGVSDGSVLIYQTGANSKNGTGTGAWKYATLGISNISGLQTALDGKQAAYGFTITGTSGADYNLANFKTTDENVKVNSIAPSSGTWYYPVWYTSTSGTGNVNANDGLRYYSLQGTTSANGMSIIAVGNSANSGTAGNKYGEVWIYSKNTNVGCLVVGDLTATRSYTFPNSSGTVVLDAATQALTNKTYNGYTLGDACAKGYTDSSSASAISTGTSLVTERDVYYGLPTINNAHNYTSSTTIYAPTGAGTSGYWLKAAGGTSAPTWEATSNLEAGKVTTTADTTNALYVVGVTSGATSTLKRDTSVTITGGAVSATSLTLAGALSGATTGSFSSNVSIGGNLTFTSSSATKYIYMTDKPASGTGTARSVLHLDTSNNLGIGYGTAGAGYNTYLDGSNVYLRYGTSHTIGLTLNSSGNVTIGSSDLASATYKLYVNGASYLNGATTITGAVNAASFSASNSSGTCQGLTITSATGYWSYIRLINKDTSTNCWDIGTLDSAGTAIAQTSAFEIRNARDSFSGISIRNNTSSYGKLVVRVPSGQCSIGYWSTDDNPVSGSPIWTSGYTADTDKTFGWYYRGSSGSGWKMLVAPSGDLTHTGVFNTSKINLRRSSGTEYGRISYYSPTYYTWFTYMSNAASGASPTGATPPTGTYVTGWALRSLIEATSGQGWTWESCANGANNVPNIKMELSSNTGNLKVYGSLDIGSSSSAALNFQRTSANYITAPASGYFCFVPNGGATSIATSSLVVNDTSVYSGINTVTLGTTSYPWQFGYFANAIYFTRGGTYNAIINSTKNSGFDIYTTANADDATPAVAFRLDASKNARCYGSFTRDAYDIHSRTDARVYVWSANTSNAVIALRAYSGNYLQLGPGTYTTVPTIIYGQYIRFLTYNTSSTSVEAIRIIRSGYVGIGTTSPEQKLHVDGTILSTGDQVVSSDATLKKDWRPLNYGISDIAKATAGVFTWKDGRGISAGTKAQDWEHLVPQLVHGEEGHKTLAYGQIAMLNTILLARQSESHEERIKRLEARVAELEIENERLRAN